jgi:hypothetical protein
MQTEITNNRRKGHVARLPKVLRDKVNSMLEDGATYPSIVAELEQSTTPPLPYSINADSIRSWYSGGYQDYLRDQAWRERLDTNADRYLEVGLTDGTRLAAGGLYAASVQICKLMDELANPSADETDIAECSRVTNALSRLSRSILMLQQYRDQLAKEKAAEIKQLDPKRELREEETLAIVDQVNRLFGLRQYRQPRPVSVPVSAEPTASVPDKSELKSEVPSTPTPEVSSAHENSQPAPATEKVEAPAIDLNKPKPMKFVPLDQRPWNWNELSEYSAMPTIPDIEFLDAQPSTIS